MLDNPDWHLEGAVAAVSAGIRVRALAADPARAGHSVHRDDPARVLAEALALLP